MRSVRYFRSTPQRLIETPVCDELAKGPAPITICWPSIFTIGYRLPASKTDTDADTASDATSTETAAAAADPYACAWRVIAGIISVCPVSVIVRLDSNTAGNTSRPSQGAK